MWFFPSTNQTTRKTPDLIRVDFVNAGTGTRQRSIAVVFVTSNGFFHDFFQLIGYDWHQMTHWTTVFSSAYFNFSESQNFRDLEFESQDSASMAAYGSALSVYQRLAEWQQALRLLRQLECMEVRGVKSRTNHSQCQLSRKSICPVSSLTIAQLEMRRLQNMFSILQKNILPRYTTTSMPTYQHTNIPTYTPRCIDTYTYDYDLCTICSSC